MLSIFYSVLFFNSWFLINAIASPIPIAVPVQLTEEDRIARMKFNLELPSNETVQIRLSFKLLTPSEVLPVFNESMFLVNPDKNITSTFLPEELVSTTPETLTANDGLPEESTTQLVYDVNASSHTSDLTYVTVEEAIESFRQHLIEKELEIAGIIESGHPFYRHFRLEYGDGVVLPIRCTYESNYAERLLKISCYEYREFAAQRILSNGEIEKASAITFLPEYIDARTVEQTYTMIIS